MLFTLLEGFGASGSLIVAIGAQNAFVLKQGLKGQNLFLTACLCSLIDAVLITLGVMGFGHLVSGYPLMLDLAKYFAIIFLIGYGCISLKSAVGRNSSETRLDGENAETIRRTVLLLLGFSLLNPHVYLDTVVLLGSIASRHPYEERLVFAIGAIAASFVWFFGITYTAQFLAPLFRSAKAWRVIDSVIGLTMFGIAFLLLTAL